MRKLNAFILAFLINALIFTPAIPATLGYQIDMLLSQVRTAAGGAITNGHVHFYNAGTTTDKTIWTSVTKATPAANPYNLDSNGTAYVFGDGLYRIVIHSAPDVTPPIGPIVHGPTAYDRDNIRYEDFGTTMTRLTVITGDNTGTLSGFKTITGPGTGNISGFDNLTVTGRTTTATLTVTGASTFADNTINGADLVDNTVTSAKILDNTIAVGKIGGSGTRDNTTTLLGDGTWSRTLPSICNLSKSANQDLTATVSSYILWQTEDSDLLGCHSPSDNTLMVVPPGYTRMNTYVAVYFGATATDNSSRKISMYVNATPVAIQATASVTPYISTVAISTGWVPVNAGDNVSIAAYSYDNVTISKDYTYFRAEFR